MPQYVVTEACYVPVGGGLKFKIAGQTVTLDEKNAKSLKGYVTQVDGDGAKPSSRVLLSETEREADYQAAQSRVDAGLPPQDGDDRKIADRPEPPNRRSRDKAEAKDG